MVIANGSRVVMRVWGGYSPKKYDGHWIRDHAEWFQENVPQDTIIGDNHFEWGMKNKDLFPKTLVNLKEGKDMDSDGDGADEVELTKEQSSDNKKVKKIRARIESIFGEVKTRWKALAMPFAEEPAQLDALVFFAFAVHNRFQKAKKQ